MSKCEFAINFPGTAEELVARAEKAIAQAGGTFNGTAQAGSFKISTMLGSVEGSYTVAEPKINISIEDKPFLVSCSKIEDELRKYLTSTADH